MSSNTVHGPHLPGSSSSSGGLHSGDLSMLAITNMLRTGNPILDLLIALSIPIFFTFATTFLSYIQPLIQTIIERFTHVDYCTRAIEYTRVVGSEGVVRALDDECRNNILIKAITMYVGELKLKLDNADVNLNAVKEEYDFDYDTYEKSYGATEKQLASYHVHNAPYKGRWVKCKSDVEVMIHDRGAGAGGGGGGGGGGGDHGDDSHSSSYRSSYRTTTTLTTCINLRGSSSQALDDFISDAFNYYKKEMAKTQDNSRYLFTPISFNSSGSSSGSGNSSKSLPTFSQHKLSDEKTFDSLFLPEKQELISLLEKFKNKEGKFKIPGVKHRIGFLFHGVPGAGKTSLIKAIAACLQRHIITIPLNRIKTNRELTQLMFDLKFSVPGSSDDDPVKTFNFTDVIFVMEDVDAASKIVLRRELREGTGTKSSLRHASGTVVTHSNAGSGGGGAAAGGDDDGDELPQNFMRNLSQASQPIIPPSQTVIPSREPSSPPPLTKERIAAVISAAAAVLPTTAAPVEIMDGELLPPATTSTGSGGKSDKDILSAFFKKDEDEDTLNLAGLLNAIDGIVDSPGRVLILTSNHPEKLDWALVRPGRIDKYVHLDYVKENEAVQLARHFFQNEFEEEVGKSSNNELETRLRQAIRDGPKRTPAELEQLAITSDLLSDFVDKVERGEGWKTALFAGGGGGS
jgi:hypothetical protein